MLALLLALCPAPFSQSPVRRDSANRQNTKADNGKKHATQDKQPTASVFVEDQVSPGNSQEFGQSKAGKAEQKDIEVAVLPRIHVEKDRWDYIYIIASLIIALFTIGVAGTAIIQVKALINSERAWLLVENAEIRSEGGGKSTIYPVIKNLGKTIARVRKVSLGGIALQRGDTLPKVPPISRICGEYDLILCPNQPF